MIFVSQFLGGDDYSTSIIAYTRILHIDCWGDHGLPKHGKVGAGCHDVVSMTILLLTPLTQAASFTSSSSYVFKCINHLVQSMCIHLSSNHYAVLSKLSYASGSRFYKDNNTSSTPECNKGFEDLVSCCDLSAFDSQFFMLLDFSFASGPSTTNRRVTVMSELAGLHQSQTHNVLNRFRVA